MKVNLGDKVKDRITGLVGIAVSRSEYLNGCVRFAVQPPFPKDGRPVDPDYIDEEQLVVVKAGAFAGKGFQTGGDRPNPRGLSNPKR